jgi:hypothetical protein
MEKELQFISNCFNINYQNNSKEALENIIENNPDWNFIFKKISQSDIAPLACHSLSGLKNDKIPDWFLERLDNSYNQAILKNLFIKETLDGILNLFSTEHIPVIALKGIFMWDVIYGNIALRNLSDIDILVKKSDMGQIERLLQHNGYTKSEERIGEISYLKEDASTQEPLKKILIEIHYDLNLPRPLSIPADFLWNNAIIKDTGGLRMMYPSLENSLIYAALHFFHHFSEAFAGLSWPPLKSILDIHEIISKKQTEINWGYILEFSKTYKIRYALYLSLLLSKIYFNTSVPAAVINKIKISFIKRTVLSAFAKRYIFIQHKKIDSRHPKALKCIYYYLMFEKSYFREKLSASINNFAREHNLSPSCIKTYCLYISKAFSRERIGK